MIKKFILTILFTLVLSGGASADDINFVCQYNDEGKLDKYKQFFELTEKKLAIDGEEFQLSSKPIITDTLISFETIYEDSFQIGLEPKKYFTEVYRINKINKKTGLMVEKQSFLNWKNEDTVWIYYYQCEIF
jgi:hypothetical protein